MNNIFILDACAVLAELSDEEGAEVIDDFYKRALDNRIFLMINKVNLLEVYYDAMRTYGKDRALKCYNNIRNSHILVINEITDDIFFEAGRLKAAYKISLADSIALAQALVLRGTLLTADHHEFDIIEKQENINFHWIR